MKTLYIIGKWFLITGFSVWAIETLVFQIMYGWHYAPYNETELYFDRASNWLLTIGIGFMIWSFVKTVKALIDKL